MQVNITITARNTSNKQVTTKVTYIRPTAEDAKIGQLAQALNALTTNTYVKATKESESVL